MTQVEMERSTAAHNSVLESSSAQISIRIFRSPEELETLRAFWSSCAGTRDSDLEIILTEHRVSTEVLRPHVMALYRGDKLDALLVGRILRRHLPLELGYFKIAGPVVNVMTFPYGALRGNGSFENCQLLIREVIRALKHGESNLAVLDHLNVDSRLFDCARKEAGIMLCDRFAPIRSHWKRELPTSVEQFRAGLSSSERQRFRQIAKKLSADFPGQVKLVRFDQPDDLERLVHDVEEVAEKTWQRKLGLGGFNSSNALRGLLKTEVEMGWLRGYVLYLAGMPRAFWIGTVYQRTFYSDFTGYDPDYAQYSLGTYLLSQILEDLCAQNVQVLDFGFSDEGYKRRFGNAMSRETRLHLFPATFYGVTLSLMRGFIALISTFSRTLLQRMGLIQRVKKVWRGALGRTRGQVDAHGC